jgi:hypothetical protein
LHELVASNKCQWRNVLACSSNKWFTYGWDKATDFRTQNGATGCQQIMASSRCWLLEWGIKVWCWQ